MVQVVSVGASERRLRWLMRVGVVELRLIGAQIRQIEVLLLLI